MDRVELICFEMISAVGNARSLYMEAIQEAKNKNYKRAEELIKEGEESFANGHHAHSELIQNEANGEATNITLLLLHAEDQMMSAESFKFIAEEFIDVYKAIKK